MTEDVHIIIKFLLFKIISRYIFWSNLVILYVFKERVTNNFYALIVNYIISLIKIYYMFR